MIIKDLMNVKGYRLTRGSKYFNSPISKLDAQNIINLKNAGAIIIGTANLHELAYGVTVKIHILDSLETQNSRINCRRF